MLVECESPARVRFFNETGDSEPELVLDFSTPTQVAAARTNPDYDWHMAPMGEIRTETNQWGVYSSLTWEITVVGYNERCSMIIDRIRQKYESLLRQVDHASELLKYVLGLDDHHAAEFVRTMRRNYLTGGG